jgi:hypothetical protein
MLVQTDMHIWCNLSANYSAPAPAFRAQALLHTYTLLELVLLLLSPSRSSFTTCHRIFWCTACTFCLL